MELEDAVKLAPGNKLFFNDTLVFNIYDNNGQFLMDRNEFKNTKSKKPLTISSVRYGYLSKTEQSYYSQRKPSRFKIASVLVEFREFNEKYFHFADLARR